VTMANHSDVCRSERTVSFKPKDYCTEVQRVSSSPIDEFLAQLKLLLPLATKSSLDTNAALGRLLLLGVVSISEQFYRSLIGRAVHVCPIAWHHASGQTMSLGAIDYYGQKRLALGLLESVTFSSPGTIILTTEKLVGVKPMSQSMEKAVKDFERICQLRHAAVHSDGHLNSKNLRDFGLPGLTTAHSLRIDFDGFQNVAAICENAVRAYNRALFSSMCDQWAKKKVLQASWVKDRKKYSELHELFYSTSDSENPTSPKDSYTLYLPQLKALNGAVTSA
jgi:hypothetical protein